MAGLDRLLHRGETLVRGFPVGFRLRAVHHAFAHQLRGVLLAHARRLLDALVHHRLRVRRLVRFVVTVTAVANHIDHHVGMEFLAIHHRETHRRQARFWVVRIDVDDRRIKALGEIAGVIGRAAFARIGGETDLVVENKVNRAAGRVTAQPRQVERLRDDPLACKSGVPVQQHRQRDVHVMFRHSAAAVRLVRARASLDDRIHRFEMAGIGRERDGHVLAARRVVHTFRAVVVLHVAGAGVPAFGFRRFLAAPTLELGQDRFVRHVHDVRQHIEPPAVRHADHRLAGPMRRGELDREIEHRHGHVEPLDRESLLAEIGLVKEALECVHGGQTRQQLFLAFS